MGINYLKFFNVKSRLKLLIYYIFIIIQSIAFILGMLTKTIFVTLIAYNQDEVNWNPSVVPDCQWLINLKSYFNWIHEMSMSSLILSLIMILVFFANE